MKGDRRNFAYPVGGWGRHGAGQVYGKYASLEGSEGVWMWELVCVVCACTQQENFVNFAEKAKIIYKLGRIYLTSIVVPMAGGEWEQSKYT